MKLEFQCYSLLKYIHFISYIITSFQHFYYLFKNIIYFELFKEQIKMLMIWSAKPVGVDTLHIHKV